MASAHSDRPSTSEGLLRLLVDRVREYAIYALDPEGRVASWNAGAERIKGYTADEIIGRPYGTFFSDEDRAAGKPERLLRQARTEGSVEDMGLRVRKDGSRFWADALLTALVAENGDLLGYAKVTRDLTEQRRAEEDRALNTALREIAEARDRALAEERRATEALQQAIRARDEFFAAVSHDLKNPLGSIRGNAQLLLRTLQRSGAVPEQRLARSLPNIIGSVDEMVGQIDQLLDVARLRFDQPLPLERRTTDLVALAERSVAAHQVGTDRHRLELHTDVAELIGEWDAPRLERVLGNLLSNAIKFSPAGGTITVTVRCEQDDAVVSVNDPGIGIPPADVPRIFERFTRGRNVSGIEGSGIGLAATRAIVERHDGTIAIESREGEGSTFTVRLPRAADASQ